MERYLRGPSSGTGDDSPKPETDATGTPAPALADLARLRLGWTAARRRLAAEAARVRTEVEAAYADSPEADRIPEALARLERLVERMDSDLIDRIDAAIGGAGSEGRAAALRKAADAAGRYLAFCETDPLARHWDGNPFLPSAQGIGAIRSVLTRLRDGLARG